MLGIIGQLAIYCSIAFLGTGSMSDAARRSAARHNTDEFISNFFPEQLRHAQHFDQAYSALCIALILTPLTMFGSFSFVANVSGLALMILNMAMNYDPKAYVSDHFLLIMAVGMFLLFSNHNRCTRGSIKCRYERQKSKDGLN